MDLHLAEVHCAEGADEFEVAFVVHSAKVEAVNGEYVECEGLYSGRKHYRRRSRPGELHAEVRFWAPLRGQSGALVGGEYWEMSAGTSEGLRPYYRVDVRSTKQAKRPPPSGWTEWTGLGAGSARHRKSADVPMIVHVGATTPSTPRSPDTPLKSSRAGLPSSSPLSQSVDEAQAMDPKVREAVLRSSLRAKSRANPTELSDPTKLRALQPVECFR